MAFRILAVPDSPANQAVKGRHFAGFGQDGEIKRAVEKVLDGTVVTHHGLADVDQFTGLPANHMHAQQMAAVRFEQQAQQAVFVSGDAGLDEVFVPGRSLGIGDAHVLVTHHFNK